MLAPTRILVPTDFSEYSNKALRQGLDIAKQYGAKVFLFHVLHPEFHRAITDSKDIIDQLNAKMEAWAKENLQKQLDNFSQSKEVEVQTDVGTGIPAEAILKEASEKGIDLIVIASLGHTGIAKYLIGSVARNVLKGATCPVLLTK